MSSSSEIISSYPKWLSENEREALETLKEAGNEGIKQHEFFAYAKSIGIDDSRFCKLISEQLVKGHSDTYMHIHCYREDRAQDETQPIITVRSKTSDIML